MCSHATHHPDGIAIDRLGREITELASHIHAATCRWLGLVAEFDRRSGWAQWGCKGCAQFLSWRCAIAPGAAREHVRVARRLQELPLIRAAFAEGRLSYSKVRALTRVENVEHEEGLLSLARHSTAAQLERMVRAYRGVVGAERAAAGCPQRYVSWHHAEDGSMVLRARLPAEEGAVVIAALEAAMDQEASGRDGSMKRLAASDVPAEPAAASVAAEDVSAETCGDPLADEDVSAETCGDPLADEDVSAETCGEPVAGGDVPAETRQTLSQRRADALVLMADNLLAGEARVRNGGDRFQVVVHVDDATLAAGAEGRCELADGAPLAAETARRLACDAAIVPLVERDGRPLTVGRKTRSVPPTLRRALASRDGGCRFPGCTNRRSVDAHHVRHWAHGGPTSIDNLVQLCRHHHRLLHEGGYSVERAGPEFVFRRPDGRRLPAVPRPPRGHIARLRDVNRRRGRPIDADACIPETYTAAMDLGLCVDALLAHAPPVPEAPGI
jgi:Domain of unknown function (DUF222)/HNH endonuclease